MSKQILVLGGGYGGLLSAVTARKYLGVDEASITLVNRVSTHQIITELHRLAAGNKAEEAVAIPLYRLLRGQNIDLKLGSVAEIKPEEKEVVLSDGQTLTYDALVVALGSETAYFGIPGLKENSFVLKSVEDANKIQAHVEERIRAYSQTKDKADATIVVGGGGLTGVELVGEFVDTLPSVCKKYGVAFEELSIICVEAMPSILPMFPQELIDRAQSSLEARGVKFLTNLPITEVNSTTVSLKDGSSIETNTMIWTGGVQGNSVVANCGIEVNRGRATVTEHLQSTSHPEVFLAGDCAVVMGPEGRPYPPTAQLAWQMGETIGFNLFAYFKGSQMDSFDPVFSGTLASLGRKDAIATIGEKQTRLKGMPACFMKEASNIRYLAHINGLSSLAY